MRTVVRSRHIFDGIFPQLFKGFVEFEGSTITKVGRDWNHEDPGPDCEVLEYDECLVMPGLHDNHVFFSGWMAANAGLDLSSADSEEEAALLLAKEHKENPTRPIYAHGWNRQLWGQDPERDSLDDISDQTPIVAIDSLRSRYWMNTAAVRRYGFSEDQLGAEDRALLIKEMTSDRELVRASWRRFEQLLLERGVVSCKDIVFDDTGVHGWLADKRLKADLYIEPVREQVTGARLKQIATQPLGSKTRLRGVKLMVDGVVADGTADIHGRYASGEPTPQVDYRELEHRVQDIADSGFSCCMTAEGDRAIEESARILSSAAAPGLHHSISDLEMINDRAAGVMAQAGITAELYPQILGLNPSAQDAYMPNTIADDDGSDFFHYSSLTTPGLNLTCGTDCPLFLPSLPESILRASLREFDKGGEQWFPQYALPAMAVLSAWTNDGHSNRNDPDPDSPDASPSLRPGQRATMAIFDWDLVHADAQGLREARVVATYVDGQPAYEA